jgi:hypothetical protein
MAVVVSMAVVQFVVVVVALDATVMCPVVGVLVSCWFFYCG